MLDGTRASLRKGIEMRSLSAAAVLLAAAALPLRAEPPSFEDFFRGVSGCSLEMARYRDVVDATSEGVVIALPSGGAPRGLLVSEFYFSPGRGGNGDAYGLLFNAPIEAVARSFPEFAGRQTVNGHLRQLLRLSDETGDDRARRKTLLMCTGGTAV
jgi:hypothetical protein